MMKRLMTLIMGLILRLATAVPTTIQVPANQTRFRQGPITMGTSRTRPVGLLNSARRSIIRLNSTCRFIALLKLICLCAFASGSVWAQGTNEPVVIDPIRNHQPGRDQLQPIIPNYAVDEVTSGYSPSARQGNPLFSNTLSPRLEKGALAEDILANDDTTGGAWQRFSDISRSPSGEVVVAWSDERLGPTFVFGQKFSRLGVPIGGNFQVSETEPFSVFMAGGGASTAIESGGTFAIAWNHWADAILLQFYDSNGTARGGTLHVNEGSSISGKPDLAFDGVGHLIVCWADTRNGSKDIYSQLFSQQGIAIGANVLLNDDPGSAEQPNPKVALSGPGEFTVVWEDGRNGVSQIFGQRLNANGELLDSNFVVSGSTQVPCSQPSITARSGDDVLVAWIEDKNNSYSIYARLFDSAGAPRDTSRKIVEYLSYASPYVRPSTCLGANGSWIVAWNQSGFRAQRLGHNGDLLGTTQYLGSGREMAICSDTTGFPALSFDDSWYMCSDIILQLLDTSLSNSGARVRVNDDYQSSYQVGLGRTIAMRPDGSFMLTWLDTRMDLDECYFGDIFAQLFNSVGSPIGRNFKVNTDGPSGLQRYPATSGDAQGNVAVVWYDGRSHVRYDIYMQLYDAAGNPIDSNFAVNESEGVPNGMPDVAMCGSGGSIIVWGDNRNDRKGDIYYQRYRPFASTLGVNQKVNDDLGSAAQSDPAITADDLGNYVIVWRDYRSGNWNIYLQVYDSLGVTQGSNIKVTDNQGTLVYYSPDVTFDNTGNIIVVWSDQRNGHYDVFAQRFNSALVRLGGNLRVNSDSTQTNQQDAVISASSEGGEARFIVVWSDYRSGEPDIFAQQFDSLAQPIGGNLLVNDPDYSSYPQESPSAALKGNTLLFSWNDGRRAKGWDVYFKKTTWDSPSAVESAEGVLPNDYSLEQNYPNPFNPTTAIEYHLLKRSHVTIEIFNVLGQKVRTLVNQEKFAGYYREDWDGTDNTGASTPSGVYFYRLKAGDYVESRKMVLLK